MTVVLWKNPQGVLEEAAIRVGAAMVLPTGKRGELVAGAWGSEGPIRDIQQDNSQHL